MKRVVVAEPRKVRRTLIAVTAPGCEEGVGRALRQAYCLPASDLPRDLQECLRRLH